MEKFYTKPEVEVVKFQANGLVVNLASSRNDDIDHGVDVGYE